MNKYIYAIYKSDLAKRIAKRWQKHKDNKYSRQGRWSSRFLRLVLADCGPDLTVFGKPIIYSPDKIHIGNHVTLNNGAQISPRGHVYIADYVTMSRGSQITGGMYDLSNWSDDGYIVRDHTQKDVFIGEGTWLCVNSIVLPGVHINGKGVIVAAGAVVTQDINEDFVIVGGVPAKIIKHLEKK